MLQFTIDVGAFRNASSESEGPASDRIYVCVFEALAARVGLELHVLPRGLGAVRDYFKHDFGASVVDFRGLGGCSGGLCATSPKGSQNCGQI